MSIEVTGLAQRQAWTDDVLPPVELLTDGLWSIPVPIPANPLRYVLVYGFEHSGGISIVDAGWNTEDAWAALVAGLAVAGYAVGDVRAVLVTHIHPDHYGLAGRIREQSDAWIGLHPADAELIPGRYGAGMDQVIQQMRTLFMEHGVPTDVTDDLTSASTGLRDFVSAVEPDRLINDGDMVDIPNWKIQALHTPGHSPGHLCFLVPERRLLLSGDHVLPRISPNISVHAQQQINPLADFLDLLSRLRGLQVDEVLPAHEWRFRPLESRLVELLEHHSQRLTETEAILEGGISLTCWEITRRLTWSREWNEISDFMQRAAVGETLAHLVYLADQGRVIRQDDLPIRWALPGHGHAGSSKARRK